MALSRPIAGTTSTGHDHGYHPLPISRVVRETPEASTFVLEVPDELREAFAYDAGQFCTFRVRVDGRTHLRCYSMSSAPAVDSEFRVTVKRTPGGVVSNFMNDQLAPGNVLEVTRPAGVFRLAGGGGDMVAFCGGSGITPVHSLVKTALSTTSRRVRLLYANRDREAVIFGSEINDLRSRYGERLTVSHHMDVEHGLAQPDLVIDFAGPPRNSEFYICGPAPFMEMVEQALLGSGVVPQRIHIERFTPPDPPLEATSPLSTPAVSRVTVDLSGKTESADHRPGTTILQTARQMGLSPPFSCESGSCATCMARLAEGTVDMRVNNALTDDEVNEGWVLTCQSVPTSPSVHVVYEEG
jgi:3-ketosteroid 9alpha-monooxygenase subunit B